MDKNEGVSIIRIRKAELMLNKLVERGLLTAEQLTKAQNYCTGALGVNTF